MIPLAREARRRIDSGGWWPALLRLMPMIVLLGLPGASLGIIAVFSSERILDSKRLIPSAYLESKSLRQGALWLGIEAAFLERAARRGGWLRPWARLRRTGPETGSGQAEDRRVLLYHFKAAMALPGALALSWWGLDLLPQTWGNRAFWASIYAIAVLGAIGLGLEFLLVLSNFPGKNIVSQALGRRPYGFFLFAPECTALVGLLVGAATAWGQIREVGGKLFLLSPGVTVVVAVLFLLRSGMSMGRSEGFGFFFWIGFTLSIVAVGTLLFLSRNLVIGWRPWLTALVILSDLSLGIFLGPWLLRPFAWRHVLDPALPLRVRLALAFLAGTALLPLGGLVIPVWIFLRHRCWPKWEPFRWALPAPPDTIPP
jgi:hypothetical protein